MHNAAVQHPLTTVSPNSNPTTMTLQAEVVLVNKHNVLSFSCPCPPFIALLAVQTPVVSSQRNGEMSIDDNPCSGIPSTAQAHKNVKSSKEIDDRWLKNIVRCPKLFGVQFGEFCL
ncbi:hypothetical protein TNCV_1223421 [Trichonephila clavipes]|nr:hypothetical protein TNCV_1223421 [Trichonephila clavipes]